MNKNELLEGGHLAAYVTGEVTTSDSDEIAAFIATDPEVLQEYMALQKTIETLSFHYAMRPNELVKKRLMKTLSDTGKKTTLFPGFEGSKLLAAASLLLALLSTVLALYYHHEWKQTHMQLSELTATHLQMAENYQLVNREITSLRNDLEVLVSPEFERIVLKGTDRVPEATAVIYWNRSTNEVMLNSGNLATLSGDRQYQLWALLDGQPIDAGVFDAASGTFLEMNVIDRADAFAITIEPFGGSESPDLATMQVYGSSS